MIMRDNGRDNDGDNERDNEGDVAMMKHKQVSTNCTSKDKKLNCSEDKIDQSDVSINQ